MLTVQQYAKKPRDLLQKWEKTILLAPMVGFVVGRKRENIVFKLTFGEQKMPIFQELRTGQIMNMA